MTTILLVEDGGTTAELLDLVLTDVCYQVVWTVHGQAALAVLPAPRPQFVLSDLAMPVMEGRRLCQNLAADAHYQAVPRVLMNIWWNDNGAALPGVTTFLPKPFTVDTLLYTMQRYVR